MIGAVSGLNYGVEWLKNAQTSVLYLLAYLLTYCERSGSDRVRKLNERERGVIKYSGAGTEVIIVTDCPRHDLTFTGFCSRLKTERYSTSIKQA